MTDLEIVRACALAMGIKPDPALVRSVNYGYALSHMGYDPLHNDEQCFALVRTFSADIVYSQDGLVTVSIYDADAIPHSVDEDATDLNRAICLCVSALPPALASQDGKK